MDFDTAPAVLPLSELIPPADPADAILFANAICVPPEQELELRFTVDGWNRDGTARAVAGAEQVVRFNVVPVYDRSAPERSDLGEVVAFKVFAYLQPGTKIRHVVEVAPRVHARIERRRAVRFAQRLVHRERAQALRRIRLGRTSARRARVRRRRSARRARAAPGRSPDEDPAGPRSSARRSSARRPGLGEIHRGRDRHARAGEAPP